MIKQLLFVFVTLSLTSNAHSQTALTKTNIPFVTYEITGHKIPNADGSATFLNPALNVLSSDGKMVGRYFFNASEGGVEIYENQTRFLCSKVGRTYSTGNAGVTRVSNSNIVNVSASGTMSFSQSPQSFSVAVFSSITCM